MLITDQIENTHFSNSEKAIIDYILNEGMNIKKMSAHAIARATFTSAPLLIRIAKKLGFSGFNEFKEAYIKELSYMLEENDVDASIPFIISDDISTIANNLAILESDTIKDTQKINTHDQLMDCLRILKKTDVIHVYGLNDTLHHARHFSSQMALIQKKVEVIDTPGTLKRTAYMVKDNDCVIVISYSGQTTALLEVAQICKDRNIPIISMTCMGSNPISRLADAYLYMSSKEMLNIKIGDFASTTSLKYLFDVLYGVVFSQKYIDNLEKKIVIASLADDSISEDEFINEK